MKSLTLSIIFLVLFAAAASAAGPEKVYTWIDENGVLHYTNTAPPKGAVIVDSETEIPHDREQALQREMEQRRYLEQLPKEEPASAPEEAASSEPARDEAKAEASRQQKEEEEVQRDHNRRNETYHQDQIEKRQRQKLREQKFGGSNSSTGSFR